MNAQERLDYLLEQVTTNTNRQIIVADIINAVGIEAGGLVLGTLQAAAATNPILAAAYQALVTVGISLSDDLRQGMIDQLALAGNWPNSVRDAVKALGRITHRDGRSKATQHSQRLSKSKPKSTVTEPDANLANVATSFQIVQHRINSGEISSLQEIVDTVTSEITNRWES